MEPGRSRKHEQGASSFPGLAAGDVYLEYLTLGHQTRVVAIDAVTGVEVTVVGPTTVSRHELGRLAVRKLQRRLSMAEETR